jgi:hypothetical protein
MWREWLAAGAAVLAVLGALHSWRVAGEFGRQQPDRYGVSAAIQRFSAVRERLPERARVAYISDVPVEDRGGAIVFLGVSYALAPRVVAPVARLPEAEWAIGNFARPGDFAAMGAAAGYAMLADLGNGVVLYRKTSL